MRLAGYAAIFDAPDKGGDIVRKGAFARAAKAGVPLLWQHDRNRRIGYVESLSEDARGLRVIARLDDEETPVQAGTGLSEQQVAERIAARVQAKQARDYALADSIRAELAAQGIELKDGPHGTTWVRA